MSAKKLIIVESPSKINTLSKYLDGEYEIEASVGHIRDLVKSKLGLDVDDGFKPTALYNVVRDFIFVRNSNALNGAPLVVFGNKLPEPGKFSVNVVTFKVQPDGSPHLFQMCGK